MDTLSISHALENSGLERKSAEAIASSIARAISEERKKTANRLETRLLFSGVYVALALLGTAMGYLLNAIIDNLNAISDNAVLINTVLQSLPK